MYLENTDYRDVLKNIEAYKLIGQTRIDLARGCVYPWAYVSSVSPGNSYRLGISINVNCMAAIDGLQFDWSVDIEDTDANGLGHYSIDIAACADLLEKLPPTMCVKLRKHFAECANLVCEKAAEYRAIADGQQRAADTLHLLSRQDV